MLLPPQPSTFVDDRAVGCDITGGLASLNFDAAELKIYGNLGSLSNPNLQYERFETYH